MDRHYDADIEDALARLPEKYRQLLELLVSDAGLSYAEIARIMGVPLGSVGPMRQRAMQLVRRNLHRRR
jgi:DNA-directed RNA polymerase specialized sigma24 family protein